MLVQPSILVNNDLLNHFERARTADWLIGWLSLADVVVWLAGGCRAGWWMAGWLLGELPGIHHIVWSLYFGWQRLA